VENSEAMAADTSSPAAVSNDVVGPAAVMLAALSDEPILAKSVEAVVKTPGATTANDIAILSPLRTAQISANAAECYPIPAGPNAVFTRLVVRTSLKPSTCVLRRVGVVTFSGRLAHLN
jgi:hypothetical protein